MTLARRWVTGGALALALAAALVASWRLLAPAPSDQDRIRTLFADAARAAEERRVSDAVAGVSERFEGEGLDRAGLKQFVAWHALQGTWTRVLVENVQVEVAGDGAQATVDLVAARGGAGRTLADLLPSEASAWRVECALARERPGWRVVRARWRQVSLADVAARPPQRDAP